MGYVLREGDRVVCVDDNVHDRNLIFTVGKTYLINRDYYGLFITDEYGKKDYHDLFTHTFKTLYEHRDNKLNELGI
jgi:hypothetical protein